MNPDINSTIQLFDAYARAENATDPADRLLLVQIPEGVSPIPMGWLINRINAIWVEASPAWTLSSMAYAIMAELAVKTKGRPDKLEALIVQEMIRQKRPLVISEADSILLLPGSGKRRMLEMISRISIRSAMPVVLVSSYEAELALRATGLFPRLRTVQIANDFALPQSRPHSKLAREY